MRVTLWTGMFFRQLGVIPGCILQSLYNFSQIIIKSQLIVYTQMMRGILNINNQLIKISFQLVDRM